MSERNKSRIVQVGRRNADGESIGWIFAGDAINGGYSGEELAAIMVARDEEELRLAKNIGEQMSGKILCPRKCVEGQKLSTYGDMEEDLFCPHCEIDVTIMVKCW